MKSPIRSFAIGILTTTALAAPAISAPVDAGGSTMQVTTLSSPFATAIAADDASLDKATAREDLSLIAESRQTSNVSNNSVNGTSTTGDIRVSDTAFQNATGMVIINANSGNNVGMNASINVNIVMTPPQQ